MVASFSSKLSKQFQATLVAAFLVVCMMGTHWAGLAHSVSHAGLQQNIFSQALPSDTTLTYSHNSDVCHLFDALTLAGFIPETFIGSLVVKNVNAVQASPLGFFFAQVIVSAYQSRAPPTLLL